MEIFASWDDGSRYDLKVAKLLKKYKIPGIFFIPTMQCELTVDEIVELAHNYEIGGHTFSHPLDLKRLTDEEILYEVRDNKEWLEDILNRDIKWFCYPRGRYNDKVIEILKDVGIEQARTTLVGNTDSCDDQYRIHPTVHVFNGRKEYEGKGWLKYAKEQYEIAKNKDGYFHIWGHSWEVQKEGLWDELEELLKLIHDDQNN